MPYHTEDGRNPFERDEPMSMRQQITREFGRLAQSFRLMKYRRAGAIERDELSLAVGATFTRGKKTVRLYRRGVNDWRIDGHDAAQILTRMLSGKL